MPLKRMNEQEQCQTEIAEMALDKYTPIYNEERAEAIYKIFRKEGVHRVLDVGCGLGKVDVYLAKKGLDVCGIDVSPELIKLARQKAKKNKLNIKFELAQLEHLKVKQKFDAVLFAGVIYHIENDEKLIM